VGKFLLTFKDYPQRQKATSYNMDDVMERMMQGSAKS